MTGDVAGTLLDELTRLAEQAARHEGCEVVEVELKGDARKRLIRIYLDKLPGETPPAPEVQEPPVVPDIKTRKAAGKPARVKGPGRARQADKQDEERVLPPGITVDDCTAVSRRLSALLDVGDLIPSAYNLEVSSPGLNRPLKKEADFHRFAGHGVVVKTREEVDGVKRFEGVLQALRDGILLIDCDGAPRQVPLALVAKAQLRDTV